jgi:hypothetical protein
MTVHTARFRLNYGTIQQRTTMFKLARAAFLLRQNSKTWLNDEHMKLAETAE